MTEARPSTADRAHRSRRIRAWTRRHPFATLVCALVALALLLRLGWGWHSSRRLAAALDDVLRRGEPVALADFIEPDLPDAQNAWSDYAEAAGLLAAPWPRRSMVEYAPYAPRGEQWETLAAASETANAAAFARARRARRLQRLQFPRGQPPGYRREWGTARELANTLADGAEYSHLRGDDAEAVERLLDGLHLARLVRQDTGVMPQVIGITISAVTLDAAQQVIPTLNLDAAAKRKPASPAQARALLAALLDESNSREWFVRSMQRERTVLLSALDQLAGQTWALRPLAEGTAARLLAEFDLLAELARRGNGRQARKTLRTIEARTQDGRARAAPAVVIHKKPVPRYSRWFDHLSGWGPVGLGRSLEQFHRESMERRLTAVMLAARMYRHDHGRWPDDAAALVPKYLDAVPPDPFREDGGPLGYVLLRGALPDGGDRPLVFSDAGGPLVYYDVGDGGDTAEETTRAPDDVIDSEPMYGWQQDWRRPPGARRREIRQYRDLSFWQPKTRRFDEARREQEQLEAEIRRQSAPEAVDNDPNKPDAPGDDAEGDGAADRPADQ